MSNPVHVQQVCAAALCPLPQYGRSFVSDQGKKYRITHWVRTTAAAMHEDISHGDLLCRLCHQRFLRQRDNVKKRSLLQELSPTTSAVVLDGKLTKEPTRPKFEGLRGRFYANKRSKLLTPSAPLTPGAPVRGPLTPPPIPSHAQFIPQPFMAPFSPAPDANLEHSPTTPSRGLPPISRGRPTMSLYPRTPVAPRAAPRRPLASWSAPPARLPPSSISSPSYRPWVASRVGSPRPRPPPPPPPSQPSTPTASPAARLFTTPTFSSSSQSSGRRPRLSPPPPMPSHSTSSTTPKPPQVSVNDAAIDRAGVAPTPASSPVASEGSDNFRFLPMPLRQPGSSSDRGSFVDLLTGDEVPIPHSIPPVPTSPVADREGCALHDGRCSQALQAVSGEDAEVLKRYCAIHKAIGNNSKYLCSEHHRIVHRFGASKRLVFND